MLAWIKRTDHPRSVTISVVMLLLQALLAPATVLLGVAVFIISGDTLALALISGGALVFLAPPALGFVVVARGLYKQQKWGYWIALILHGGLAIFMSLTIAGAMSNPTAEDYVAILAALGIIAVANVVGAISLLMPVSRAWCE